MKRNFDNLESEDLEGRLGDKRSSASTTPAEPSTIIQRTDRFGRPIKKLKKSDKEREKTPSAIVRTGSFEEEASRALKESSKWHNHVKKFAPLLLRRSSEFSDQDKNISSKDLNPSSKYQSSQYTKSMDKVEKSLLLSIKKYQLGQVLHKDILNVSNELIQWKVGDPYAVSDEGKAIGKNITYFAQELVAHGYNPDESKYNIPREVTGTFEEMNRILGKYVRPGEDGFGIRMKLMTCTKYEQEHQRIEKLNPKYRYSVRPKDALNAILSNQRQVTTGREFSEESFEEISDALNNLHASFAVFGYETEDDLARTYMVFDDPLYSKEEWKSVYNRGYSSVQEMFNTTAQELDLSLSKSPELLYRMKNVDSTLASPKNSLFERSNDPKRNKFIKTFADESDWDDPAFLSAALLVLQDSEEGVHQEDQNDKTVSLYDERSKSTRTL